MDEVQLSFEFFPPSSEAMEVRLWKAVEGLVPLSPRFVSVTYGAGGNIRTRTHETVKRIHKETSLAVAAHLTCVAASRDEIDAIVRDYCDAGISHIVALRGDMPDGSSYNSHEQGYASTPEMIIGIRNQGVSEISVSAYPEVHPDTSSMAADIELLRRKVEAGAVRAITQFCFETDDILRYRDKVRAAGLEIPIVPGLLPVTEFNGMARMARRCGASVPDWLTRRYEGLEDQPEACKQMAVCMAVEQCQRLLEHGITMLHFYTLNRAEIVSAICQSIGVEASSLCSLHDLSTANRNE